MIENFNFLEVLYKALSFLNTSFYLVCALIALGISFLVFNRIEKERRMNKVDYLLDLLIKEKENIIGTEKDTN